MRTMAVLLVTAALVFGQERASKRTADGKPDFSGIWSLTGGFNYVPAAKDLPPFQPGAEAQFNTKHGPTDDPVGFHCLPAGMPRQAFAPFPLQIFQPPGHFVIHYEYMHFFRAIPTSGGTHPADLEPSFMGHDVGHWEGDTFVTETVGLRDDTWLEGAGHMHSDALRVSERYTLADTNSIRWEVTIDDPKIFTKPWTVVRKLERKPDWTLGEYICEENNREGKKGKYE
jgi:hypothetical protein